MPRVLDWLHQESTEPADPGVQVVAGTGAAPTYAVRLVAVAVRLAAGRSGAVACWVVGPAPGVYLTVLPHRRLPWRQRV